MENLKNKRIISVAVTGSWPTKEDNPNVPITPKEIADSIYESWEAGAAIAHIHVRKPDGSPSIDYKLYKEVLDLLNEKEDCDICINITSSGDIGMDDDARISPILKISPELASFDAGTLNWQNKTIFENHPRFLEKLGRALTNNKIKPEIEIFDVGMIYNALYYLKKGVLKEPLHFQFVLGAAGGMPGTIENLVFLRNLIPSNSTWSACGIGKYHMPIMLATIAMGGHLRVGMEDNVMYHKNILAESNAQFVSRAKRLLEESGLEAATPSEARKILNLA